MIINKVQESFEKISELGEYILYRVKNEDAEQDSMESAVKEHG